MQETHSGFLIKQQDSTQSKQSFTASLKSKAMEMNSHTYFVKTHVHVEISTSTVTDTQSLLLSSLFPWEVKGKALTWWGQHAPVNKTINSSLLSITPQSATGLTFSKPTLSSHTLKPHLTNNCATGCVSFCSCIIVPVKGLWSECTINAVYTCELNREFNKTLFTLCPPYLMFLSVWNLRSVTEGGPCGSQDT